MKSGISIRVVDLYSIKPLEEKTLQKTTKETKALIVAKDHFAEGGIGEAVKSALEAANIISLAVRKIPGSEKPEELILYEEISKETIVREVKKLL